MSGPSQSTPYTVSPESFSLGPPVSSIADQSLYDFYFGKSQVNLYIDVLHRPNHYSPSQRELVEDLQHGRKPKKEPTKQELNELVFRFVEPTEQKKVREDVARKYRVEEDLAVLKAIKKDEAERSFESQMYPDAIDVW